VEVQVDEADTLELGKVLCTKAAAGDLEGFLFMSVSVSVSVQGIMGQSQARC